CALWYSNQFIF
nr:immunoglobulin light chain junction region [Mus musculus]NSM03087.1 immunoglobulin light chain junction region [Mus musculus]NSM03114.1 immunoglobulin light chain junction region [Mus musculus]NSM03119.1 immunoglobulin light chain junction region [Mus musculus]NSM03132.1 immunoglobulin light chain junction region [Mus musculus]